MRHKLLRDIKNNEYFLIDGMPFMSNMANGQIIRLIDMLVFNTVHLRCTVIATPHRIITARQALKILDQLLGNRTLIFADHPTTRMVWAANFAIEMEARRRKQRR